MLSKYFDISDLTVTHHKYDNTPSSAHLKNLTLLSNNCLDSIYEECGEFNITSAYRSEIINTKVGGSKTSSHSLGFAADIQPTKCNMKEFQQKVLEWAKNHKFDQIIIEYPTNYIAKWIHIGYKNKNGLQRKSIVYTVDGKKYIPITDKFYLK